MTGEQLPKYMTAAFSLFNASLRANYENSNEIFDEENVNIQTMSEMFLNKNEPYVNTISGSVSIDNALHTLLAHNSAWYVLHDKLPQERYDPIRETPQFQKIVKALTEIAE